MKRALVAILATTLALPSMADGLYLGGWSVHFFTKDVINENHQTVMVEYDNFLGGTMINSFGHRSYILGYSVDLYESEHFKFNAPAGIMSGYGDTDMIRVGDYAPLLGVGVEFKLPYVRPTVLYTGKAAMVMFKLEF